MANSIVCLTSTYDPLSVAPLANARQQQEAAHGGVSSLAQAPAPVTPPLPQPLAPASPSVSETFSALAARQLGIAAA